MIKSYRRSLRRTGAVVVAGLLTVVAVASANATDTASDTADTPAGEGRMVAYHGYRVKVPTSWRVVDLDRNPNACVRFDEPTVYVGRASGQPECPRHIVGRTAGLVIEPLDGVELSAEPGIAAAGHATPPTDVRSRNGLIEVAVEQAGVRVSAIHSEDNEEEVRAILAGARVAPGGKRTAVPARVTINAPAAPIVAPGTFTGKGFDTCAAPTQSTMDAWRESPYKAIGIYTSGGLRACAQPNLTPGWVANQAGKGWRLIPIDVGRQAPCSSYRLTMSTDPATARAQGREAATAAVDAATRLGLGKGTAIYSDIEGYGPTPSCTAGVLSYVSGWTEELHAKGWLAGVYSSADSGMRDLAAAHNDPRYVRPDHIWFAWWNGRADTDAGSYVPASLWGNHQRLHQYAGEVAETWGGVRLAGIDRNQLDVAAGIPTPPSACATASRDFTAYPTLRSGVTGAAVKAAQCLLTDAGHGVAPNGVVDAVTVAATTAYQTARGLPVSGEIDTRTWTALLARGDTVTVRNGSTGPVVRRLQRAVTAALGRTVAIDGEFGPNTEAAVRDYQRTRGLTVDGVVGPKTWAALQAGR